MTYIIQYYCTNKDYNNTSPLTWQHSLVPVLHFVLRPVRIGCLDQIWLIQRNVCPFFIQFVCVVQVRLQVFLKVMGLFVLGVSTVDHKLYLKLYMNVCANQNHVPTAHVHVCARDGLFRPEGLTA